MLGGALVVHAPGAHLHTALSLPAQVCASPVNLEATVSVPDEGVHWSYSFDGDESVFVPDLSISVPGLGAAGLKVGVELEGAKGALTAALTLTACVDIDGEEVPVARRVLRVPVREEGGASPAVNALPEGGVGSPTFEKCLPDPPLQVVSGTFDFSWVQC